MKAKSLSNSGSTMLVVLSVLGTLSACVIAALNYTAVISRDVMRSNTLRASIEVGDGAIDYAFAYWRETCRAQTNMQRPTDDFASIPLPTQAMFPGVPNFTASSGANPATGTPYTIANFKIKAVDPLLADLASTSTAPTPSTGMGLSTRSYYYIASADVTLPAYAGRPVQVKLRRVLEKQLVSPWNYAIFFVDDLEFHPGAQTDVTGWVHTNSNLYTHHNTLNFLGKVTYSNDSFNAYKPQDVSHDPNGSQVGAASFPNNIPQAREQEKQPFGLDSTRIFNTTNTNGNDDSYRELVERPGSGTDPLAESRYYNQADVRILIDGSNNVVMKNKLDQTITTSSSGVDGVIATVFTNALAKNEKFQDNREGAEMRIVSLDMSKINAALRSTGNGGTGTLYNVGFGGVIYISDTSGSSTTKRGIRLRNGAIMPPGGLTIASDNPVYIQGDYNTGRVVNGSGVVITETPSNVNNNGTGSNTVTGYTRQPCAVVADAINILSNAWTDARSYSDMGSRDATPTTINTAIVSGNVPSGTVATGANSYSGGAENFPRLHEDWGNGSRTFTYCGSMVQLYASQQSTRPWGSDNVYNAPRRSWSFDTQLYSMPPPGTLILVSYNKQRWFVQ